MASLQAIDSGRRLRARTPLIHWLVPLFVLAGLWLVGPWLAPHDPYDADLLHRLQPPSAVYPLGTEALGRCLVSRLLHGARLTTAAALTVVVLAAGAGTLIGLVAGTVGGVLDRAVMRVVEGVSVLPALAVSLVIAGALGLGLRAVIVALALVHWTDYARLVRNLTVVEKAKPYVRAAEALGASRPHLIRRHLVQNVVLSGPLFVLGAYSLAWVILSFAGLSFLGLGVEPGTPEWGRMIAEARAHLRDHPRLVLAPGLAIMALVILVNLWGDALGDRARLGPSILPLPTRRNAQR